MLDNVKLKLLLVAMLQEQSEAAEVSGCFFKLSVITLISCSQCLDLQGHTALHIACMEGHQALVKTLLATTAAPNTQDMQVSVTVLKSFSFLARKAWTGSYVSLQWASLFFCGSICKSAFLRSAVEACVAHCTHHSLACDC